MKRWIKYTTPLHQSFFIGCLIACLILFARKFSELNSQNLPYYVTTFLFFVWFMIRYISITRENCERTFDEWLLSIAIAFNGFLIIESITNCHGDAGCWQNWTSKWTYLMMTLSFMASLKDLQVSRRLNDAKEKQYHIDSAIREALFGITLLFFSFIDKDKKIIPFYAGLYVIFMLTVLALKKINKKIKKNENC